MTPTASLTGTRTASPTATATSSLTATPSPPVPPTATATPTPAVTSTPTVAAGNTPVIFPNPVPGTTAQFLPQAYAGTSDVKVQVYTLAFKLVLTKNYPAVPSGTTLTLELVDDWGEPLSGGLYYLAVTTREGRAVAKLVLRPS